MTPRWKECKIGRAVLPLIIDPHHSAAGPWNTRCKDTRVFLGWGVYLTLLRLLFFFFSLSSLSLCLEMTRREKKITPKLGTNLYVRLLLFFPLTTSCLPESNPERRDGGGGLVEDARLFYSVFSASGTKQVPPRQAPPSLWSCSKRTGLILRATVVAINFRLARPFQLCLFISFYIFFFFSPLRCLRFLPPPPSLSAVPLSAAAQTLVASDGLESWTRRQTSFWVWAWLRLAGLCQSYGALSDRGFCHV